MNDMIYHSLNEVGRRTAWYPTLSPHQRTWSAAAFWVQSKQEWQVHVTMPGPGARYRVSPPPRRFTDEEEAKGYLRQQIVILRLTC